MDRIVDNPAEATMASFMNYQVPMFILKGQLLEISHPPFFKSREILISRESSSFPELPILNPGLLIFCSTL
jgi:hypothetical protein